MYGFDQLPKQLGYCNCCDSRPVHDERRSLRAIWGLQVKLRFDFWYLWLANCCFASLYLNGRVKSGQRWSGQNRPTDVARDSRCFTLSFAY